MTERRKLVFYFVTAFLNLLFLLVTLLGAEAIYRYRLYLKSPGYFVEYNDSDRVSSISDKFSLSNDSPWKFNERYGYEYVPGTIVEWTVGNDRIKSCGQGMKINEIGNPGDGTGSYADAELKILVFGDSWMAATKPRNGFFYTVPYMLQQHLERQLRKKVRVMNFGRDGYGILQMFDLAADKIAEYKPDVVIFAFITDDLTRDRFWRTVGVFDGERRVLTTIDARPNPDLALAVDTQLIDAEASADACGKALNDPAFRAHLERKFIKQYKRAKLRGEIFRPSILTTSSYLYSRLRYGDPFFLHYQQKRPSVNPRHQLHDFMDDPRFAENITKINAMEVPYLVIHLAIYNEIRDNQEYIFGQPAQQSDLLASLAKATRRTIHPTLGSVPLPAGDLSIINSSQDDYHPSLRGMEFYADLMVRTLEKQGYIHGVKRRTAPFVSTNRSIGPVLD